jgi:hypothetical protein
MNKKKSPKTEILKYSKEDIIHLAVIQNEAVLKRNFQNIVFVHAVADKGAGNQAVGIFLSDTNDNQIPLKVQVHMPDGNNHVVNTIVIKGLGKTKAHFANSPTGSVALSSAQSYTGSACCILQDPSDSTNNFMLTSCHVLTDGDLANPLDNTNNENVTYNGDIIGTWAFGSITSFGDYATVALKDDFDIENSGLTYPKGTRDINGDIDLNAPFYIKSQFNDGSKGAYFHGLVCNKISIEYDLGHSQVYDKIMMLNDSKAINGGKTLTQGGDSGGAVYDGSNSLVGIIVGGNDVFSYAIPVKSLIDGLKLNII